MATMPGSPLTVSIVVPAFNEARGLGTSLASIRAATAVFDEKSWRHELIVCDNNSTDATAAIARDAGATVVFEPINQISRARNAGAAAATGDWLVFVDADSYPSRELFADAAEQMAGGRVLAGGATVTLGDVSRSARAGIWGWNTFSRIARLAAGSFIFCEARAFRALGGFSLAYFAGEELDLFIRLKREARRSGRSIVILSHHPLRTSARKIHLYSGSDIAVTIAKAIVTGGRILRRREACDIWYDGRREG
jgi:glycosyltransferase involved in cell wall biosynthesis